MPASTLVDEPAAESSSTDSKPSDAREWAQHPNFPEHVRLLATHADFRSVSAHLLRESERGAPLEALEVLYFRWIDDMRRHEEFEEKKLYPFLARRFQTTFDAVEVEHQALRHADRRVCDALAARDQTALALAIRAHHEILGVHYTHEEQKVVPLLLSLTPEEFAEFKSTDLTMLLERLDQREALATA